jgi:hypothetical protein
MGFTTYIRPEPAPQPSLKDRIALLSAAQKTAILQGFATDVKPHVLKHDLGIPIALVVAIRNEIEDIEATARILMREEVLITEGEYDTETGEEITPPVYNEAPETIAELKAELELNFTDIFTSAQISAVVELMIDEVVK